MQNPVSHQNLERILHFLGSMSFGVIVEKPQPVVGHGLTYVSVEMPCKVDIVTCKPLMMVVLHYPNLMTTLQ